MAVAEAREDERAWLRTIVYASSPIGKVLATIERGRTPAPAKAQEPADPGHPARPHLHLSRQHPVELQLVLSHGSPSGGR